MEKTKRKLIKSILMTESITLDFIFKFFLVFARCAAMLSVLPGFGDDRILMRAKIILVLFISLVVMSQVSNALPTYTTTSSLLLYYLTSESLIGLMLGLSVKIYYTALYTLGNLISMQSGLSAATIFDPSQREQIMLFSSFIATLTLVMIFATDTHHIFLAGLIESYEHFKPGVMLELNDLADHMSQIVSSSFLLAFKISAPFLIIGIAILAGSGVLSRLMPSLQVLFVITPAQILVMYAILFIVVNNIISLLLEKMVGVF